MPPPAGGKAGFKEEGALLTKAMQEPDAGGKVKIWARSAHVSWGLFPCLCTPAARFPCCGWFPTLYSRICD